MFHLEGRVDQETFRVTSVTTKGEHFADDAAARLTLNMDDKSTASVSENVVWRGWA